MKSHKQFLIPIRVAERASLTHRIAAERAFADLRAKSKAATSWHPVSILDAACLEYNQRRLATLGVEKAVRLSRLHAAMAASRRNRVRRPEAK